MVREPDKKLDDLAHEVIGCAIEVHRHLGPGFVESFYEEALAIELRLSGVPFERQKYVSVKYKNHRIGKSYLDFVVSSSLILELKAVDQLAPVHKAQVISYLKATGIQIGLLMNFNVPVFKNGIQRIILT